MEVIGPGVGVSVGVVSMLQQGAKIMGIVA